MPNGSRKAIRFIKRGRLYFWIFSSKTKLTGGCYPERNLPKGTLYTDEMRTDDEMHSLKTKDVLKIDSNNMLIYFKDGDICKYQIILLHDWETLDTYDILKK